jgi:hypothetical protein
MIERKQKAVRRYRMVFKISIYFDLRWPRPTFRYLPTWHWPSPQPALSQYSFVISLGLASVVFPPPAQMTTPHVIASSSAHPTQTTSSNGIVGSHYRVGKKIGEGSFGVVFEGVCFLCGGCTFSSFLSNSGEGENFRDQTSVGRMGATLVVLHMRFRWNAPVGGSLSLASTGPRFPLSAKALKAKRLGKILRSFFRQA